MSHNPNKPAFDREEAKENLLHKQQQERERLEQERIRILKIATDALREEFKETTVEVYLVGSITQPYHFTSSSDVDIVLKNFTGDRFDVWTKLEDKVRREVEIILFENCTFQDFIISQGYKVL